MDCVALKQKSCCLIIQTANNRSLHFPNVLRSRCLVERLTKVSKVKLPAMAAAAGLNPGPSASFLPDLWPQPPPLRSCEVVPLHCLQECHTHRKRGACLFPKFSKADTPKAHSSCLLHLRPRATLQLPGHSSHLRDREEWAAIFLWVLLRDR